MPPFAGSDAAPNRAGADAMYAACSAFAPPPIFCMNAVRPASVVRPLIPAPNLSIALIGAKLEGLSASAVGTYAPARFLAAPALDSALPSVEPPYAPNPAINPLDRLPVAKAVAPPTAAPAPKAVLKMPNPAGPSAKPAIVGRTALSSFLRENISGNPVSGLIVTFSPWDKARAWRPATSLGAICTSMVSPFRPLEAMWSARA